MFGVIIVTHGNMADGIGHAVEFIMGKQRNFITIGLYEGDSIEIVEEKIKKEIIQMDYKESIIFVDIPGATPNNGALLVSAKERGCRVITGVNLPMVLECLMLREREEEGGMETWIPSLLEAGRDSICVVSLV